MSDYQDYKKNSFNNKFWFLAFALFILSGVHSMQSAARAEINSFLPFSESLKGVDTVVYNLKTYSFQNDVPPFKSIDSQVSETIETIFSEFKDIKVLSFSQNFANISDPEIEKENVLRLEISVTRIHNPESDGQKTKFIASVGSRISRGKIGILDDLDVSFPFTFETSEEFIDRLTSNLHILIGHLPNYIVCANERYPYTNCKGPNYKLYELKRDK